MRSIISLTTGQRKALRQWLDRHQLPFRLALDRYGKRSNYPCLRLDGDPDVMVVAHFEHDGKTVNHYAVKRGKGRYGTLPEDTDGIVAVLYSLDVSAHSLMNSSAIK